MRRVFQDLEDGVTAVEEVPVPVVAAGHLFICAGASLISAATERLTATGEGVDEFAVGDCAAAIGPHADRTRSVA